MRESASCNVGCSCETHSQNSKQRVPGGVSSLYRFIPSDAEISKDEAERRLERIVRRLIGTYGGAEVRRRIRASDADDHMKAMLVLRALTADE